MSQTLEASFIKIDQLIKSGKLSEAWSHIKLIKISDIPREKLVQASELSRRVREPLHSTKILGKVMVAHREKTDKAKDEEILAYVGALVKLGFFAESHRWLEELNDLKNPKIYDLKARIHVTQWNYSSAVFYFKRYISQLEKNSYGYLVGYLNLASSLVNCGLTKKARPVLEEVQELAKKQKSPLILGNSYELFAQYYILKEDFENARDCIEQSLRILDKGESAWKFYSKKWQFIIELKEKGTTKKTLEKGEDLLHEAIEKDYGEGARDIEFHLAIATNDQNRLLKVYFGSHHPGFREKLLPHLVDHKSIPESFDCHLGGSGQSGCFDFLKALESNPSAKNLFFILTQDLYRPLPLGFVFHKLYPGEFFDPYHSSDRLYASVKQLRKLLPDDLGISVQWEKGSVQLIFNKPITIKLCKDFQIRPTIENRVVELRHHFGKQWFTKKDVKSFFNLSDASSNRYLTQARKMYSIEKKGQGRAIRYRFK